MLPSVSIRLSPDELLAIDEHARALGLRRSSAMRRLIRGGLAAEGVPGGAEPLPVTDDLPSRPPSAELTLEAARRLLLTQAQEGSATAAAALERSLRLDRRSEPRREAPAGDGNPMPAIRSELARVRAARRRESEDG